MGLLSGTLECGLHFHPHFDSLVYNKGTFDTRPLCNYPFLGGVHEGAVAESLQGRVGVPDAAVFPLQVCQTSVALGSDFKRSL